MGPDNAIRVTTMLEQGQKEKEAWSLHEEMVRKEKQAEEGCSQEEEEEEEQEEREESKREETLGGRKGTTLISSFLQVFGNMGPKETEEEPKGGEEEQEGKLRTGGGHGGRTGGGHGGGRGNTRSLVEEECERMDGTSSKVFH